MLQFGRFFKRNSTIESVGSVHVNDMSRSERVIRIIISWCLLILAKVVALATPLYFHALVDKASQADIGKTSLDADNAVVIKFGMINTIVESAALGLMVGYIMTRISAGAIHLISEFILFPATTSVGELLPRHAFTAALLIASKRREDSSSSTAKVSSANGKKSSAGLAKHQEIGGHARRILDRGLRSSNVFLYRSIFNLLPSFVESFFIIILISYKLNKTIGITAGVVAYTFVYVTSWIMHRRAGVLRRLRNDENTANGYAEDAISLAETVASFGTAGIEELRYAAALKQISKTENSVRESFSLLKIIQILILGIGSSVLILCTWIYHDKNDNNDNNSIREKTINGSLLLSQALFSQLCSALNLVGQHFRDCVNSSEDMRELEEIIFTSQSMMDSSHETKLIINKEKIINKKEKLIESSNSSDNNNNDNNIHMTINGKDNHNLSEHAVLEIHNLVFSYPKSNKIILNNIDFSIPRDGYSIGIVGPSGSGKSTLFRVMLGLENIANSGSISINGVDMTHSERIQRFSLVGQENDLFRCLNLLENVQYGSRTLPFIDKITKQQQEEALHNAATDALLYPIVEKMKDGWSAGVGPRGRLLSGGERQRVCLARALYRQELASIFEDCHKCVLLMDEVTSSLDAKSENVVTNAILSRVRSGASAVIIAHRLTSVQRCDEILVLRNGEVVERGTHDQLLENSESGWYAEAWRLQSSSQ